MPGPVADAEVKEAVAAALGVAVSSMPAFWDKVAADANDSAYADVLSAMVGRGFTKTQVEAWSQAGAYQRDQATFWALVRGGAANAVDPTLLKMLDRREDMKTVAVLDADGVIAASGLVGHGDLATDNSAFLDPDTGLFKKW